MNLAKINMQIASMFEVMEPKDVVESLQKSPLLTVSSADAKLLNDEQLAEVLTAENLGTDVRSRSLLPFEAFRFVVNYKNQLKVGYMTHRACDGFYSITASHLGEDKAVTISSRGWKWSYFKGPDAGREVRITEMEGPVIFLAVLQRIIYFLYVEAGLPIVEVAPKGYDTAEMIRRKVSWRKRREYYTVVDPTHKANNANVTKGAVVTHDKKDIQRCAHHRRSHFRLLKSARYGKNQGKKIRVKEAWVGPDEWVSGNQVYRIRNPKKD